MFFLDTAPSIPTDVVVEVTTNNSILIRWNPPAMANGVLLNYTVRVYNILNNYAIEISTLPYEARNVDVDGLCKNNFYLNSYVYIHCIM